MVGLWATSYELGKAVNYESLADSCMGLQSRPGFPMNPRRGAGIPEAVAVEQWS